MKALVKICSSVPGYFSGAHGGGRPFSVFQSAAPDALREQLAAALPQPNFASLRQTFLRLLEIVEHNHALLGKKQGFSRGQQVILAAVRERQLLRDCSLD